MRGRITQRIRPPQKLPRLKLPRWIPAHLSAEQVDRLLTGERVAVRDAEQRFRGEWRPYKNLSDDPRRTYVAALAAARAAAREDFRAQALREIAEQESNLALLPPHITRVSRGGATGIATTKPKVNLNIKTTEYLDAVVIEIIIKGGDAGARALVEEAVKMAVNSLALLSDDGSANKFAKKKAAKPTPRKVPITGPITKGGDTGPVTRGFPDYGTPTKRG